MTDECIYFVTKTIKVVAITSSSLPLSLTTINTYGSSTWADKVHFYSSYIGHVLNRWKQALLAHVDNPFNIFLRLLGKYFDILCWRTIYY